MKVYTVTPNAETDGWFLKLEDTAPIELYDTRTEAVEKGEEMAKENRPAKLVIYDRQDNKEDERSY
ncbi:DUF2188 domain-containing protein [Bacillus paralicheniformis]|uniref:DUF2188 domain-containing protein n=1 Tax=Bacillus paralicheniformis TaxID=1648923 RepID=UPI00189AB236|nr:DUF2188 domain-containing protein [Bacillus paralicheniformis]